MARPARPPKASKSAQAGTPAGAPPAPAGPAAPRQQVLGVAAEMYPLIKTGGLADVVGALPAALAPLVDLHTLLPGYPAVLAGLEGTRVLAEWPGYFGGHARLLAGHCGAARLLVLEAPHLYDRPGNPYSDAQGHDWPDNAQRYAALGLAAARVGWGELAHAGLAPEVLHLHDWQAGLAPAYLRYLGPPVGSDGQGRRHPACVFTVHNLAFQGQFGAHLWPALGLPGEAYSVHGVEYHGGIGFLKAGLQMADAITTVSPSYAQEILSPAVGMGLDPLLRWRAAQTPGTVSGIVNGIDTDVWNPATDPQLVAPYSAESPDGHAINRQALLQRFGLPVHAPGSPEDGPVLCMVSRLTPQKGIDLVAQALEALVAEGARLLVLGTGEPWLEHSLLDGARRHPTRVAVRIGYDEALAHLMQGGSDAILIPSRFEPCGLTQLYGLRYGCVPVVSRVGGLADTVIDANHAAVQAGVATGLQFSELSAEGVLGAVRRLVALYRQPAAWQQLRQAGMRADVGWGHSAQAYAALYRRLRPLGPG